MVGGSAPWSGVLAWLTPDRCVRAGALPGLRANVAEVEELPFITTLICKALAANNHAPLQKRSQMDIDVAAHTLAAMVSECLWVIPFQLGHLTCS